MHSRARSGVNNSTLLIHHRKWAPSCNGECGFLHSHNISCYHVRALECIYFSLFIGYYLYLNFKCYPISSFLSSNPLSHPSSSCLMSVFLSTTTHSHLTSLELHLGIKPSQDQGPLLPLMPYKAIFCFIFNWRHGFLHVYSLFGCLVPGSSGGSGWLTLFFL